MKTAPKTPPPQHISASKLRQHLSQVLQDVEAGEIIIIEKRGEPVARVTREVRACMLDDILGKGSDLFSDDDMDDLHAFLKAERAGLTR